MARISWPSSRPKRPSGRRSDRRRCSPSESCVAVVAGSEQRPQLLDVAALAGFETGRACAAPARAAGRDRRRSRAAARPSSIPGGLCRRARRRRPAGSARSPASSVSIGSGDGTSGRRCVRLAGQRRRGRQFLPLDLAQRQRRAAPAEAGRLAHQWPQADSRHASEQWLAIAGLWRIRDHKSVSCRPGSVQRTALRHEQAGLRPVLMPRLLGANAPATIFAHALDERQAASSPLVRKNLAEAPSQVRPRR